MKKANKSTWKKANKRTWVYLTALEAVTDRANFGQALKSTDLVTLRFCVDLCSTKAGFDYGVVSHILYVCHKINQTAPIEEERNWAGLRKSLVNLRTKVSDFPLGQGQVEQLNFYFNSLPI